MYADTIASPELRHEVPVAILDPFLYAERDGVPTAVLSQLDADSARAARPGLRIIGPEALGIDELLASGMDAEVAFLELAVRACRELEIGSAAVPPAFPLELADLLRNAGIDVQVDRPLFIERRRVKTAPELEGISRAQRAAESGMAAAASLLRQAEPAGSKLLVDGEALTCERLKWAIRVAITEMGGVAEGMIVAHGPQTAVGHDRGSGAIAPGEPVVIDLWPSDSDSGCFADMTRTFVVGDPGEELRAWHALCRDVLERAVNAVRPGKRGRALHELACDLFQEHGHPTQLSKTPGDVLRDGFFHALGHGIGLQPHEAPNVGRSKTDELVEGDVLAIEPGLYRHGYGGCRIEDLVRVTEKGAERLTDFPYDLEVCAAMGDPGLEQT
jgi:Xaa-Pro aminopeptidase